MSAALAQAWPETVPLDEVPSDPQPALAVLPGLRRALADGSRRCPGVRMRQLVAAGLGALPQPAQGRTLERWRALAEVAHHDLSLAKLYEGHADALAILHELRAPAGIAGSGAQSLWCTWASEPPGERVMLQAEGGQDAGSVRLSGTKAWCSGAEHATHALLTAWWPEGRGPQLVAVDLLQPGISVSTQRWRAIGMADSSSGDVSFQQARGVLVGGVGDYLERPGFWQGGAGIAACWWGGARSLGAALHAAVAQAPAALRTPFRLAALGRVDVALGATAALLQQAAAWIDAHPQHDAQRVALRARQAAEACARRVLDETGRSLGATPFCRDADFARMAADLPVFIRQSHAERDDAALGERVAALPRDDEQADDEKEAPPWSL